ncbi:MAG: PAS domain-containing protein, partial [Methylomicrobium sp.]|nr:PAS domain-containing protein [Methylomicrobium sp.]
MYAKLSYRVLLIEDDPSDAHLVSRYLKLSADVGFELTWVVSLSEGLAQLQKNEHDILLLDLSLPDSKGLETVKAIRSFTRSSLPLIVLTGHDDTAFALDILESGVQDYLIKGRFDGDALIRAIRYALHRSKLEQKLHEAEERWRFALEGAGDGVWDWNLLTNEVFYSPRWKALLGFSEDEIDNNLNEWEKRVYPLDLPVALANIQAHLDGRVDSYGCEHRLMCKNGQWRWFMDRGVVVSRTDEGLPQRMIGTLSDITNRKNMEQELQQSKQFAVSTIDAL